MRLRKNISAVVFHTFVIMLGIVMIYPILWMISSSFKENSDVFATSNKLIPEVWNFSSYSKGFESFGGTSFLTFFKNSFIYTIVYTIGIVLSTAVSAYAFARIKFRGRNFWFVCMILTMLLPAQVLQIPRYIIFKYLGWLDSYLPLVVPAYLGTGFNIFLVMQFMRGIPKDFDEAAKIDGCNRFMIFSHIIVPMIVPSLITVTIFAFYGAWDDFMGPLLYLSTPSKYPVSLGLKMFSDPEAGSDWPTMFAMATLSLVPIFVVFFGLQKYLLEGVVTSGVKG